MADFQNYRRIIGLDFVGSIAGAARVALGQAIRWLALLLAISLVPAVSSADDARLEAELTELLKQYATAKEARGYDRLAVFWDTSDARPFYLAEEMQRPATDWDALEAYWNMTDTASGWVEVEYSLIAVKPVGPDEALAFIDLRWDMAYEGFERPVGGSNRTLIGVRRVDGQWRFHMWVEAPLAAYFYIRELYQLNVRPDVLERRSEPSPWGRKP